MAEIIQFESKMQRIRLHSLFHIICGHIYGGGLAAYPLAEQKGKEIWMTEHLSGEKDTQNTKTWY